MIINHEYPNPREVIVDGKGTWTDWGLILTTKDLRPPTVKEYLVDIPSGDGKINLTESLTGEPKYDMREMTFGFTLANEKVDIEKLKTELNNLYHGRELDFSLSFDPEYTYHGIFEWESYSNEAVLQQLTLKILADPYKTKGLLTDWFNISDGARVGVLSGHKRVRPTFEFTDSTLVCYNGESYRMPKGSYTMDDVVFTEGANFVTFLPSNQRKFLTYGEASEFSYDTFGSRWRIFEWYRGIEKWIVSKLAFNGEDGSFAGDLTVTATNTHGDTASSIISLPEGVTFGANSPDDVFVFEDSGECYAAIADNDSIGAVRRYPLTGSLPYFDDYPIASVEVESDFGVIDAEYWTLSVSDTNTHINAEYSGITYSEYASGGDRQMTYADMKANKISALTTYLVSEAQEVEDDFILEDSAVQSVYIQHEWSDL